MKAKEAKRKIIKVPKMGKKRMFTATKSDALKLFKIKTGKPYIVPNYSEIRIFHYKLSKQTKTRKYMVGTYLEYLNRQI